MLGAILLVFTITGINSQCLTGNDSPVKMFPHSKAMLTAGKFNFTLEALRKAAAIESKDNLFFSPHSLHEALTLAFFGAREKTEEALKQALHIPVELSKTDVLRSYALDKSLKRHLEESVNILRSSVIKLVDLGLHLSKTTR